LSVLHIVMFRWKSSSSIEDRQELMLQMRDLPAQISSVREYVLQENVGTTADNYDFVVRATFDDIGGYLDYKDHPAHREIIQKYGPSTIDGRAALQVDS